MTRSGALAAVEVVGLQQPRDAEVVVGVQVGDVDLVDLDEPGRALHLALRALAAVEQQPVAADPRQQAGGRAPRGRHRAAGAEEDHVHVHARSVMRVVQLADRQGCQRRQARSATGHR